MVTKIDLSGALTGRGLASVLHAAGVLSSPAGQLRLEFATNSFLHSSAVSFLCSWGLFARRAGVSLSISGSPDVVRYLARMDVQGHLQTSRPLMNRLSERGRFMPVMLITDDDSVFAISNALCDLILCQCEGASAFLPAAEWAVNEIIDNVRLHSDTPVPGCVCAQYYPAQKRLEVAIVDHGRGIRSSLEPRFALASDDQAIKLALQRGVTRDPNVGQGNGLAGAKEIASRNRGGLVVWTGTGAYEMLRGTERPASTIPMVAGTGVAFTLNTDIPVDLAATWIAPAAGWSYIDAETARLTEAGGLRVTEACAHTAGRSPATALRRKVLALCPALEAPLTLDFSGVKSASSSFLDELLGRLAADLGERAFHEKIRVTGMREETRRMANAVVAQRLGHGDHILVPQ